MFCSKCEGRRGEEELREIEGEQASLEGGCTWS